ncbi:MAG: thioredoxin family protein [Pseudomonas sp.]|uniref:DUF899 domain-containing protein n=1 Tax=Pseudomonas abieticivorans TaxID=2931382 RepID=UPI0020C06F20|nr:thioredoxin family protein [Pseudomonas sp. PIA16]MDE1166630.1 thioredoxin family protein [Pseudomonas sp.]
MNIDQHAIVSRDQWLAARKQHLEEEKAFTRERDRLSAQRRALPWVKVDKAYHFQGPEGSLNLADLFGERSQLVVYHFMYSPDWDQGCTGCSFLSDHLDGANQHLAHHDVALVAVSHAPLAQLLAFKQRMGWQFDWVSSWRSDFDEDFEVAASEAQKASGSMTYNYEPMAAQGEMPGLSVFYKNPAGEIFHTYSAYARGLDILVGTYNYLDLTPKGRNEEQIMDWVKLHDQYEGAATGGCCHH